MKYLRHLWEQLKRWFGILPPCPHPERIAFKLSGRQHYWCPTCDQGWQEES